MTKLTVDSTLRQRLSNLDSRMELCDESGRTLGYFIPAADQERLWYAWARTAFTDEEIERARREPGEYALAEILAELEAQ